MPPALLTGDRLIFRGRVGLTGVPYPSGGDIRYGRGVALRTVGSQLRLFANSYISTPDAFGLHPQPINEYVVPDTLTGNATWLRNLGTLPNQSLAFGLGWDEPDQVLYQGSGLAYGTAPNPRKTLSRGHIDPVTQKLVSEGSWSLANWSYKMAYGGPTAIPAWLQPSLGGHRLLEGYGGYLSVLATGPVSMGGSVTAFSPPATGSLLEIPNLPLQRYPFSSSNLSVPRQHRPTNYKQYFENCTTDSIAPGFHPQNNPALVPIDPTVAGTGYWDWTGAIFGAGAFVDTPNYAGLVLVSASGEGCDWYGNNWGFPNPCSNLVGSAAAINSTRKGLYWLITDPQDLIAVASGSKTPTQIQSVMTAATAAFAGLTTPLVGYPSERFSLIGASWESTRQLLVVGLYQAQSNSNPWFYFFSVDQGGTPLPQPLLITTSTLPPGVADQAYPGATLLATGGTPPYAWSQTGAPPNLALSVPGNLTGTPLTAGDFTVHAQVIDAQPVTATRDLGLTIAAAPPANDGFADAIALPGTAGTVSGTTIAATTEPGEPPGTFSVWYTWIGTGTPETFSVDSAAHQIQIYTGASVAGLTPVAQSVGLTATLANTLGTAYAVRITPTSGPGLVTLTYAAVPPPTPVTDVIVF